ncbi:ArpU family phage packaging/lysis transcriptional regulator, partial [Listeria monocytogenes]
MGQLFNLPQVEDINYIQTVRAVRKFFKDYLTLRLMAGDRKFPNMTTMYKITPPNFSNEFHSKVEDAAIHNVDNVHAAQEAVKKYDAIMNQLEHIHRKILFEKFIHNLQD